MNRITSWYAALGSRDRRALLLGLCVLVPALSWAVVVRPWWSGLVSLEEAVAAESATLERERELLADAAELPDRMEGASLAVRRKQARLLGSPVAALAEAELAGLLEGLARESRVLVLELQAAPPRPGDAEPEALVPIRMRLLAESDFAGLLTLVDAIETDPLLMRAGSLTMQAGEDPGVMRMEAIIEAFAPMGL